MDLFLFVWPITAIDHSNLGRLIALLKSCFKLWIKLKCFECHVLISYITATTARPITLPSTTTSSRPTVPQSTKHPSLETFFTSKLWTTPFYDEKHHYIRVLWIQANILLISMIAATTTTVPATSSSSTFTKRPIVADATNLSILRTSVRVSKG